MFKNMTGLQRIAIKKDTYTQRTQLAVLNIKLHKTISK